MTMNKIQSEAQLEKELIEQLKGLDYDFVVIPDEEALKTQLEIYNWKLLNNQGLSDSEFERIYD